MRYSVFILFLWTFLFTFCSFADDTGGKSKKQTDKKVSETQVFSGLKLKGQLKKPDLSYIYKRTGLRTEQIVDIPENFDDEIIQGAGTF